MRFDGFEYFGQVHSNSLGLHDELFDFMLEQSLLVPRSRSRRFCHDRSQAGPDFKEALVDQVLNNLVCRVGMDFQICSQRAHGREWLARKEFAADESFGCGVDDLIEDGFTRA